MQHVVNIDLTHFTQSLSRLRQNRANKRKDLSGGGEGGGRGIVRSLKFPSGRTSSGGGWVFKPCIRPMFVGGHFLNQPEETANIVQRQY